MHAVDDRQLAVALLSLAQQALRLIEEPRVLERDGQARGNRGQQVHVGRRVRVLAVEVLERDDANDFVARYHRHAQPRARIVVAGDRNGAQLDQALRRVVVQVQGFPRADHVSRGALLERAPAFNLHALAAVQIEGDRELVGLRIVQGNERDLGVEDVADFFADEIEDGLHVELGGQALLHAVDQRELGVALFGFLEQALGLIEEAGILQRDREARGNRIQQVRVGLGVSVLAIEILQRDDANDFVTSDHRHPEPRERIVV